MSKPVFLDYAATTPVREEVLHEMLPYLCRTGANPSASYASARRAKSALEDARAEIAHCIGVLPQELYFTSGGTEADNWALRALLCPERRHIVTSAGEHHAVLDTCAQLERDGCEVTVTPVDAAARASVSDVADAVRSDTAVVSVMYANNETGALNSIGEIAEAVHEKGVPLHTDAVAAAGHVAVHAGQNGADLLSLSAHKFYGPPGIGALYIREGLQAHALLQGGRQERGLRAGTQNVAGAVGMAAAIRLATEELDAEYTRLRVLREEYRNAITDAVPDARFLSPKEQALPGVLSVMVPGLDAGAALIYLDRHGFEAAAGAACSTGASKPSHVLLAAGLAPAEARCVLRISLGRASSQSDAAPFAACLAGAVSRRK